MGKEDLTPQSGVGTGSKPADICGRTSSPRWRFAEALGVFSVQLCAIAYATWPLVGRLTTHVPLNLGDPMLNAYLFGWGGHAIVRNPLRIFDATMFDPEPWSLAFLENMLGFSAPLAPLLWLTDDALLVTNVALLVYPALAGLGTYYLVRHLGATKMAAIVCAVAYTVTPSRLAQIAHIHVYGVYVLPLVVLALWRLSTAPDERRVTRSSVLLLGAVVALGTWSSLTGAVMTAVVFSAWVLWTVGRRSVRWDILARGGLGVLIGLALSIPVVAPYLIVRGEYPDFGYSQEAVLDFSAYPRSYLSPPPGGGLVESFYGALSQRFGGGEGFWEKCLFPGAWLLAASAVALVAAGRRHAVDHEGPRPARAARHARAHQVAAVAVVVR